MSNKHCIYMGEVRGISIYANIFVLPAFLMLYISGGLGFSLLFIPVFAVHELSHMLAAYLFEIKICSFVLLPTGAVMQIDSVQKVSQLIAIYLFAPFMNIMLCCVFYAVGLATDSLVCIQIALVNGFFALFSILPIYPLDGGNVVKALLSKRLNERQTLNIMFCINIFASVLAMAAVVYIFLVYNRLIWQIPVAVVFFVHSAYKNKTECTANYVSDIINKDVKLKKSLTLASRCIYVFHTASIAQVLRCAGHDTVNTFRIVDDNFNVLGEINESELLDATIKLGTGANVCMIDKIKKHYGAYMML